MFNKDEIPKDCDVRLESSGYKVTLTHVPSGNIVTVTLTPNPTRGYRHKRLEWKVECAGFMGKYSSLEMAMEEAWNHLQPKLRDEEAR